MTGIRIRTPSRLHFGLLGWGPLARRQFGGVGLMINSPGIELIAEPSSSWAFEGPLANRVETLMNRLRERIREYGMTVPSVRIRVIHAPPEHVGLGVGTQLGLAAAVAVLKLAAATVQFAVDPHVLASLTGRGYRSGIGLHGFHRGGLIVDGGRKSETKGPPLLARVPFPEDWSILIVQPRDVLGLHGSDEIRAFASLPHTSCNMTAHLCQLVLLQILPAVIEHDLPTFGAALEELQACVGECFAPAQGGTYATPEAAIIVENLKEFGFVGVGQSSWGPTVYAFSERTDAELTESADRLRDRFGLDESTLFWTKANNQGAHVMPTD